MYVQLIFHMKHLRIFYFLLLPLLSLSSCSPNPRHKTLAIQGFGSIKQELLDTLRVNLSKIYEFEKVIVLPHKPLPQSAFVRIKSPRYRADTLIRYLKLDKPNGVDYVIGLTNQDISTTKREPSGAIKKPVARYQDWGIFGLGYRPGPSSIVSTYRIQKVSNTLFMDRLKKIAMHEVGHNLGLKHCPSDEKCVMRDAAESIRTIDQVCLKLCNSCQNQIK